jgi:hypothetical protein
VKYNPLEARVVLIDGPVAVYIHEAPTRELVDAIARLNRLLTIAVLELDKERAAKEILDGPSR